jgi:hypothetical protein
LRFVARIFGDRPAEDLNHFGGSSVGRDLRWPPETIALAEWIPSCRRHASRMTMRTIANRLPLRHADLSFSFLRAHSFGKSTHAMPVNSNFCSSSIFISSDLSNRQSRSLASIAHAILD